MNNVKFMKYPSLTNHYKVGTFSEDALEAMSGVMYYATEKLDGSNVSLSINLETGDYVWASRNREVTADAEQFGVLYSMFGETQYEHYLLQLASLGYTAGTAHIYGELFGGNIQRQDYNANKENRLEVRFFDIIVEVDDAKASLSWEDLNYVVGEQLVVPMTKMGKLEDLILSEPETVSQFGGQNEGYVYKPVDSYNFEDGNYPVIKHKTDEYMETRNIKRNTNTPNPYKATEMDERLIAYVTPQRLMNVISHGDITPEPKNIGVLITEMLRDIVKEFSEENDMNKEHVEGYLNKHISKQVAKVVREEVLKGGF